MASIRSSMFKWLPVAVRQPGFWFIFVLLVLITLPHYGEALKYPFMLTQLMTHLELDRHAFERILYLAPIVWAGFLFAWKGAFLTSVISLACMLPRILFFSEYTMDAAFETAAVFIIGNVLAISFHSLRREREQRVKLETAQKDQEKATEQLKHMQQNLRYYLRQATRAQEEERKRISHELHDDTIQALIVLSRQLDALAATKEGISEEHRQQLESLWQQTDHVLQGVRRLSQDLRPAALDRLGLLPALEWLAANNTDSFGIATTVHVEGKERRLSEEAAIAIFRIAQEALRNVWRHSGATSAEVTVIFGEKTTIVSIKDNGTGFTLPDQVGELARKGKLGLTGIQERAQLVNGTFTVESDPGKGATITVEIPE